MQEEKLTNNKYYEKLSDWKWRLDNLYAIIPEVPVDGKSVIQFKLREAQRELVQNMHNRIIINKCRKIGYSTLLALYCLDQCIFNKNFRASVIDYKETSAFDKLEMLRNAWFMSDTSIECPIIRGIWTQIKNKVKLVAESKHELRWSNGSVFTASTTTMGSTPQLQWISELGPLSVHAPDRAAKIKRGSLNSVAPDAQLIIESTAEGAHGIFYDLLQLGLENKNKMNLEKTEYKLIFKPWFEHPSYCIEHGDASQIDDATKDYFKLLQEQYNIQCTPGQQLWYYLKKKEIGDDIYSQYPSTFEESVKTSTSGAIYPQMINIKAGNKIRPLTKEEGYAFYTAWDLGVRDATCGILFQIAGRDILLHRYFSTTGSGAAKVAQCMKNWEREYNCIITKHFLPHDAGRRDYGNAKPYTAYLTEAGIPSNQLIVLPVTDNKWNGIRTARNMLSKCWFDVKCNDRFMGEDGETLPSLIQCLENYKRNAKSGQPVHDIYSNGADAFRYIAEALELSYITSGVVLNNTMHRARPTQQRGDMIKDW